MDFPDIGSIGDNFKQFMDDYGMPLGVAAQGAGTYLRGQANQRILQAQQQKIAEERARQADYQKQIDARTAAVSSQLSPAATAAARQGIAAQYQNYITPTNASPDAGSFAPGVASAPKEVKDAAAAAMADANKRGAAHAAATADWGSYGGLDTQNRIALGAAGRDIGRTVDFSRGSASVLPYQLQAAQSAGKNLNLASDLANGAGSLSFLWGATAPKPKPAIGDMSTTPGIRVPTSVQNGRLDPGMAQDPGFSGRGRVGLRLSY